jgi:hypothetical protein
VACYRRSARQLVLVNEGDRRLSPVGNGSVDPREAPFEHKRTRGTFGMEGDRPGGMHLFGRSLEHAASVRLAQERQEVDVVVAGGP